jgi:hypothetical protein
LAFTLQWQGRITTVQHKELLYGANMVNPENSEGIEFRKLGLRGFEQFYRMIEQGTIICPKPNVWSKFHTQFVKRANPDGDLHPLILGLNSTSNEKNTFFVKQINAAGKFYNSLGMKEYTWQKEIFDYFENLEGRQSELVVVWKKATVKIVLSNLVQRFRLNGTKTISWFVAEADLVQFDENFNRLEQSQMRHRMLNGLYQSQTATVLIERYDNFSEPHLDGNYCQFGGCSGIGDNVRPTADIRLKSDIYDYVEKAFGMSNPQIEFKLEFTEPIQREGMSLSFDQHAKNSRSSNHFTLDTDAIGGTGIWHAYCELVEIKNVPSTIERVSD